MYIIALALRIIDDRVCICTLWVLECQGLIDRSVQIFKVNIVGFVMCPYFWNSVVLLYLFLFFDRI